MRQWMIEMLTGESSRTKAARPMRLTRDEAYTASLFREFTEISSTVEALRAIPRLARNSPPRRSGVDAAAYLRMMVELYLSEVYILKERCDTYRQRIARAFRKDKDAAKIQKTMDAIGTFTADAFKPVVGARSSHVHQARHEDPELGRLATLTLLATDKVDNPVRPKFEMFRARALRDVRKAKLAWMERNNREIEKFLDLYCGAISPIVLTKGSSIRFPAAPRTSTVRERS